MADKKLTTLTIKSNYAQEVLAEAEYDRHPAGRGWIKPAKYGRYHAYIAGSAPNKGIELHLDKTINGFHNAVLSDYFLKEGSRLTDIAYRFYKSEANAAANQAAKDACWKYKMDLKREVEKSIRFHIKPKPRWMPKFVHKWIVPLLLKVEKCEEADIDK